MKRLANRWLAGFASATVMLGVLGCGGGGSAPPAATGNEEATVSGRVTIKGVAVTKGEVVFDPANVQRKDAVARTAPINPNGTYTIKTLVGGNSVTVRSPEVAKDPTLSFKHIEFDAKAGAENQFNIEL